MPEFQRCCERASNMLTGETINSKYRNDYIIFSPFLVKQQLDQLYNERQVVAKEKYRTKIQYEKFIEKKGNSFHVQNLDALFPASLDNLDEKIL